MARELAKHGLPKPKFREFESELRTYFYRHGEDFMKEVAERKKEKAEILSLPSDLSDKQIQALDYMRKHSRITNKAYRELFEISERTARRELKDLVGKGILQTNGVSRNTFYAIRR